MLYIYKISMRSECDGIFKCFKSLKSADKLMAETG